MNKRDYAVDFIRLVAILAVVVIHTTTYFLDRVTPLTSEFYVLHAINQFFRFAVPAFFAISGYLLASHYSKGLDIKKFYSRRFGKILIPYFSWSLIYFLVVFPNPIKDLFSKIFINDLLTGDTSYQLYFIPAIIILYFIFPILINFKNFFLNKWFIFLLFIVEAIIQSYVYFAEPKITILSCIPIAFYNLLPFLIGIYAAIKIDDFRKFVGGNLKLIGLITIISLLLIYFESLYMFATTLLPMYLRDQWRITVPIYGLSASGLLYYFYMEKLNKTVSYLSRFSLGVFFIHVAILHNLLIFFFNYKLYDFFSFLVSLFLTIFLSFLFCIVLSRIKFINWLYGLRA
ncbi:MAG TPA: acyltransferase [Patescibacteria group bacterium]|nr:acyltransferase [Patescibacteria group bacterium]